MTVSRRRWALAGAATGLAFSAGMFVFARWYFAFCGYKSNGGPQFGLGFYQGNLKVSLMATTPPYVGSGNDGWQYWLEYRDFRPEWDLLPAQTLTWHGVQLAVPFWLIALCCAGTGAYLLCRNRSSSVSVCAHCGYDRAGLTPAASCPECGRTPEKGS